MKVSPLYSHSRVGNEVWRLIANMHLCTHCGNLLSFFPPLKLFFSSGEIKKYMHFPVHPHPLKYRNSLLFPKKTLAGTIGKVQSSPIIISRHLSHSLSLLPPSPSSFPLFLKEARFRDILPPPLPHDEL